MDASIKKDCVHSTWATILLKIIQNVVNKAKRGIYFFTLYNRLNNNNTMIPNPIRYQPNIVKSFFLI